MEYVLLDMRWNLILNNKKLDFDIHQLAAIHIDEELHTVSTFHRLNARDYKTAKQITYMMDVDDDVIMDFENAWEEFKQWLPKDVVFIVWNPEIRHVIQWYNKLFRKKPIHADFVELQMIQQSMLPIKSKKKSIETVMRALGLTWEQSRMLSVLYCVQCMLRLYRKLWKAGMKYFERHEWDGILRYEEYAKLQQQEFFPEITNKCLRADCYDKIKEFCSANRFQLNAKKMCFEIDTKYAVWQFDLANWGEDLIYTPKKYVQMPRHDMKVQAQEQNIEEVLQNIFARILFTEEQLKYGVGSADVEAVLEKLCNLKYS